MQGTLRTGRKFLDWPFDTCVPSPALSHYPVHSSCQTLTRVHRTTGSPFTTFNTTRRHSSRLSSSTQGDTQYYVNRPAVRERWRPRSTKNWPHSQAWAAKVENQLAQSFRTSTMKTIHDFAHCLRSLTAIAQHQSMQDLLVGDTGRARQLDLVHHILKSQRLIYEP